LSTAAVSVHGEAAPVSKPPLTMRFVVPAAALIVRLIVVV